MASSAKLYWRVAVDHEGKRYSLGDDQTPLAVTLATGGEINQTEYSIATTTTETIWDAAVAPTSFLLLVIYSDKDDVMLEFQGTATADNHHFELKANVPLILGSDDTLAYNAASFTGAAQKFKKIIAKNNNAATTLVTRLVSQ